MPIDPSARSWWPSLNDTDFTETSPEAEEYNCIAHAVGDNNRWWDPTGYTPAGDMGYWPLGIPRALTLEAFRLAYATKGYEVCADPSFEAAYEKIAIYASSQGEPTHAAKQLLTGVWTSKLGKGIDIEHVNLECLTGGEYGSVAMILSRPRRA